MERGGGEERGAHCKKSSGRCLLHILSPPHLPPLPPVLPPPVLQPEKFTDSAAFEEEYSMQTMDGVSALHAVLRWEEEEGKGGTACRRPLFC